MKFRSAIFSILLSLTLTVTALPAAAQTAAAPPAMVPNSFADLAARVQDAVVNISTSQQIKSVAMNPNMGPGMGPPVPMPQFPPGSPFQDFFEEFFNGPFGPMGPGMGGMDDPGRKVQSLGSGFVIDGEKGIVVTNNHVIDSADEIKVILHDDTKLDAKVLGRDKETDLALLQVNSPKKLIDVTWGDSDAMRVGDWVLAVGNPFGLGGTVTSGIISARQRNINAGRYDDFIQTDAPINRGNSGGPMFNLRGEVIGINTAIFSPNGGSIGIGFAIPSNLAKPVIEQLLKYGSTRRGWIGVRIQEVTPEIADSMGLGEPRGALIASVTPDGPAAKAGIKQGDVILDFADHPIKEMRNLPRVVADTPINTTVAVKLFRPGAKDGQKITLTITPGQLEKAEKNGLLVDNTAPSDNNSQPLQDQAVKMLGLRVAPLNNTLRQRYRLAKDVTGLVVTDVSRQSDAAEKGLMPGDVILEINQKPVAKPEELIQAVKQTKAAGKTSALLLVNTQNNLRFVAVKLTK